MPRRPSERKVQSPITRPTAAVESLELLGDQPAAVLPDGSRVLLTLLLGDAVASNPYRLAGARRVFRCRVRAAAASRGAAWRRSSTPTVLPCPAVPGPWRCSSSETGWTWRWEQLCDPVLTPGLSVAGCPRTGVLQMLWRRGAGPSEAGRFNVAESWRLILSTPTVEMDFWFDA